VSLRLASWIYDRALRVYPASFRSAYAAEMALTFHTRALDVWASRGILGRTGFVARELCGVVLAGVEERHAGRRALAGSVGRTTGKGWTMPSWREEIRHALRRLRRSPGFTLATVVTLGLAIGANTAIFSVVHSVALSPLPYPDARQLVWLDHDAPGLGVDVRLQMTPGLYVHYSQRSRTLAATALWSDSEVTLTGQGEPMRMSVTSVTHTLGDVLRVPPIIGRWLVAEDDDAGGSGVVVLSFDLWRQRFGSDPEVIGRTILLEDFPMEVVGVMPPSFTFPNEAMRALRGSNANTMAWIPRNDVDPATARLASFRAQGIARLAPGVTAEEAQAELNSLLPMLPDVFPDQRRQAIQVLNDAGLSAVVIPLKEHVVGNVRKTLWILLGTVGFVLLIACANVGNLFLVRAEAREREVAVRAALGAGRRQLRRFYVTEGSLLTLAGAALGLVIARFGVQALVRFGPRTLPRLDSVGIHAVALVFTGALAVLAAILFTAMPMLRRSRGVVEALRDGGRGATVGHARLGTRHALVVSQVALALVLLVGSGLMVRSYWSLHTVDPGFTGRDDVLTFQMGLPRASYPDRRAATAFYDGLIDRLGALPGVEAVGAVSCLPLEGWCGGDPLQVEGRAVEPGVIPKVVAMRRVTEGYFQAMGIPLLRGRYLERVDSERRTGAAVISRDLADRYFPDEDPIGRRVYPSAAPPDTGWYTVVGVVGDTPTRALTDLSDPLIYMPLEGTDDRGISSHAMTLTFRTSGPASGLAGAARAAVWERDPTLALAHMRTLDELLAASEAQTAFTMALLLISAVVALLLGGIGTYAVIAYVANQRRAEVGIRMALGASAGDMYRLVLLEGGFLALTGIAIGLVGAFALTGVMESILFDVSPTDPTTYAGVSLVVLGVAALAMLLPARRAASVDPTTALRGE
jgi:putative ABC transport system permease protein